MSYKLSGRFVSGHVGEWVSNQYPDTPPLLRDGESQETANTRQREWLSNKRLGRPLWTNRYSVKELEAQGVVGLYLTEDVPLSEGEVVPTPPERMEPGSEHLYNINGRPGIVRVEG